MTRWSSPVGEVRSRPVELQVVEPDIRQVAEPVLDLCAEHCRRRRLAVPELFRPAEEAFKSRMVIAESSAMLRPSILTASASGLRRAP